MNERTAPREPTAVLAPAIRPRRRGPVEHPRAPVAAPLPLAPAPAPARAEASPAPEAAAPPPPVDAAPATPPPASPGEVPAGTVQPAPPAPDVGQIAESVYGLLTERLARERERRGW
jgi:hypothetical protein